MQRIASSFSALPRQAGRIFLERRIDIFEFKTEYAVTIDSSRPVEAFKDQIKAMVGDLNPGDKIAIPLDGTATSGLIAAALCSVYGKEHVSGFIMPHLSVHYPDGTYAVAREFCGEVKTIPVTMAVADICNELSNAGIPVESEALSAMLVLHARAMVFEVAHAHGYLMLPSFTLGAGVSEIRELAKQFGVPTELLGDFAVDLS